MAILSRISPQGVIRVQVGLALALALNGGVAWGAPTHRPVRHRVEMSHAVDPLASTPHQDSAESGDGTADSGLFELLPTSRRPSRAQAGDTSSAVHFSLEGQSSRIRALMRSRAGFVRALAEASTGIATQSTIRPPPTRA